MSVIRFYDPRRGPFCGLSNLHPVPLRFEGVTYATPEHAFQVYRAREAEMKAWLAAAPTPELSAAAGDALTAEQTTPGWETGQLSVMARILRAKFADEPFRSLLLSTGTATLVEWSPEDSPVARFWGLFEGAGDNHLGRLLMALRAQLAGETAAG
ncbi:NADAR family protein [Ancylobacter lacus]|uniref:NADAR family protein n=1 Tax=Ancylobacter lacus TaxID=2579970 RepID=UPI001BCC3E26|nr:NADAR family protein [Ancylobacter lacus]